MKSTQSEVDLLIVGAGPYGSVIARQATDAGLKCIVIDARPHVAGNCHTERKEGIDIHRYGPHIFHTDDEEVWAYVNRFTSFVPFIYSPIAVFKGQAYNLPFNMNTFVKLFGTHDVKHAMRRLEEERAEIQRAPRNLEEQAIKLVGRTVYETLIKGYTEKQWGRSCSDLPAFIIKRLPVRYTFDNNYFDDRYQGIPEDGYTALFSAMLEGIDVRLGVQYRDFAQVVSAKKTVYTGMIDEFFDYRFGRLEYRSLKFRDVWLDEPNAMGAAAFNHTDAMTPFTRVVEHKHFNRFRHSDRTVVTYEYPVEYEGKPGETPYYPIGMEHNRALHQKYVELAEKDPSVVFGGRLGDYRYYDMDDTIRMALNKAEQLIAELRP